MMTVADSAFAMSLPERDRRALSGNLTTDPMSPSPTGPAGPPDTFHQPADIEASKVNAPLTRGL
jgi:hypothetical protein